MEPIAIVGLSCRFPGAQNPAAFWDLLSAGRDAVREVPPGRWHLDEYYDPDPGAPGKLYTRFAGFLDDVDGFDPQFFRISPREALALEPQHRLMLELSWEALEDAGLVPARLRGSPTGVYLGLGAPEYHLAQQFPPAGISAYTNTGHIPCMMANRVSYFFDFRGPSLALDTACSSSLVAVHLACQGLIHGDATLALAGGVNLMLLPLMTIGYCKVKALAPDGRCKTFDARADGYGRGEGAGVVVLKKLSAALADGDDIYAVIRGSAVNQDGLTNGLTAPNRFAQEEVLRRAYKEAAVSPAEVQYIEAHGTGTLLGDPIEAMALGAVLGAGRPADSPCAVGSVKTNIGHLEAAAGVASLIKVALAIRHRAIPPSLNFLTPNPHIAFDALRLKVQQRLEPWPAGPALAGVSAFGFGGTNAHAVLSEPPALGTAGRGEGRAVKPSANGVGTAGARVLPTPYLLPLSGHSPEALQDVVRTCRDFLLAEPEAGSLVNLCFSTACHRSHHDYRLAVVADSVAGLVARLDAFLAGQSGDGAAAGRRQPGSAPRVAFLFPAAAPANTCRDLFEMPGAFRDTLRHCDDLLRLHLGQSVLAALFPSGEAAPARAEGLERGAVFALEYSLAMQWRAWGVEPNVVVGRGVGQYVAACLAGAFSLEDALEHLAGAEIDEGGASLPELCRPLRLPVEFASSAESLRELGCRVGLQVGPGSDLVNEAKRGLVPSEEGVWLAPLTAGRDDLAGMLESLGALYALGLDVRWSSVYPAGRRIKLPAYPFQRQRYWFQPEPERAPAEEGKTEGPPLLGRRLRTAVAVYESSLEHQALAWLRDHRVRGLSVVPGSAWLEMALAAGAERQATVGLRDVVFERLLALVPGRERIVQLALTPGAEDWQFEVHSLPAGAGESAAWVRHARGRITAGRGLLTATTPLSDLRFRLREAVPPDQFYQRLLDRGLEYGPAFRCVEQLWRRDREALGRLHLSSALAADATRYRVHPALLDGALQLAAAAVPADLLPAAEAGAYVPTGLSGLCVHRSPPPRCWAHLTIRRLDSSSLEADLRLLEENGQVAVEVSGLILKPFDPRGDLVGGGDAGRHPTFPEEGAGPRRDDLLAAAPGRRQSLLQSYLHRQLAQTLGLPEAHLDVTASVNDLGLDSLMALKLASQLERDMGLTLGMADLVDGPSVATLAARLLEGVGWDAAEPSAPR